MFIPGETIVYRFNLPFPNEGISMVYVTFKQENRNILTKTVFGGEIKATPKENPEDDSVETTSYFTVALSQEESLLFKNDKNFKIQLNVAFTSGTRCASIEMDGDNGVQHIRKVVTANEQ